MMVDVVFESLRIVFAGFLHVVVIKFFCDMMVVDRLVSDFLMLRFDIYFRINYVRFFLTFAFMFLISMCIDAGVYRCSMG